jgi:hypothetical protein
VWRSVWPCARCHVTYYFPTRDELLAAVALPEAIALLQTTLTGLAIVALATGQTDQAPVVGLLTHLLDTLPRSPATKSSGAHELGRKDRT